MSTLIFAATDTTSAALSRILHMLVDNTDVQQKLRDELIGARKKYNGDIPYDELVSLPYLDAVCRETLRLHPPVSLIQRTTREDVILPLSSPIKGINGKDITELFIPNNTDITLSLLSANRDPELWGPDSHVWKPERWISPLPETIIDARMPGVYSNVMTFSGGGRACIGFKFSQPEMKVVLSILLESFTFETCGKEIVWHSHGVAAPTIKGSASGRSEFPVKLSLVGGPH